MSRSPVLLLGRTLRQHIGGRWAVSLLLFAIYIPFGIVATVGNLSTAVPGTTLGRLLLASTLSLIPVGLLMWLSGLTWLRHRRVDPAPVIAIVLLGAVIGIARSASMYALSVTLGIQEPDPLLAWTRSATGAVQGAAVYPLGVLAFSLVATYRDQRRTLLERQVAWESRRLEDARQWDQIRTDVIDPIAEELTALGDDLDREVIDVDAAAATVRERAHAIWGDAQPTAVVPRVRLSATIVASLRERPFATWLILAVWLPTVLGTTLAVGEIPRAPLGALASAAVIAVIFQAANALVARVPGAWWAALPVGLVLAVAVSSPALGIFGVPLEQGTAEFTAVNALWLTMLVVLSSLVIGALRRGEEILAELHASVDVASVETLAQEDRRRHVMHEVASTLHGTLQGRLASLPGRETAGDAVRETLALLRTGSPVSTCLTLDEVATIALEPWGSLMDVRQDCTHDSVQPAVAQAIADALEECVSNAFRHGGAQHLLCRMHLEGTHVDITVTDDGRRLGPDAEVEGLGSRILDRCGTWSRTYAASGTTVRIAVPI